MLRNIVFLFLTATLSVAPAFTWATEGKTASVKQQPPLEVVDVLASENAIVVGLENYREAQRPELVLYLDEIAFNDLPEMAFTLTEEQQKGLSDKQIEKILEKQKKGAVYRRFLLQRKETNRQSWRDLYERNARSIGDVQVDVAVKLKDGELLTMNVDQRSAEIPLVEVGRFVSGVLVLAVLAVFFATLARRSRIIRSVTADTPADADAGSIPYSLARTQMAAWFFLVAASYLFIWAVTGEVNSITGSELVLLGISASTALGAVLIERNVSPEKKVERKNSLEEMEARLQATKEKIGALEARFAAEPVTSGSERLHRIEELNKLRTQAKRQEAGLNVLKGETRGFLLDLVSDPNGVTFHRFQILGWTLVLGLVYITDVFSALSLPEFNTITLGLMGISSGTYLGFKFPEPKQG